jgi:outer membrane protein OmpA-like peptidoglycan-associated protein
LWIVTFSDMTTNLLTFFVLLLSLGQVRDNTLFDEGQTIAFFFLQSVKAGFGVRESLDLQNTKVKYFMEHADTPKGKTKDAKEEQMRRLFKTLRQHMETSPSQLVADRTDFSIANVRFAEGQTTLDEPGKRYLSRFCLELRQNLDPADTMLYVVGLAGAEETAQQQWSLSAKRAHAVAEYMRQMLDIDSIGSGDTVSALPQAPWRIFSWGAGSGGNWAGQDIPEPGQSQILIGILKSNG